MPKVHIVVSCQLYTARVGYIVPAPITITLGMVNGFGIVVK